ncbi:hypothetical protein SAMN05216436_1142 [bacterium A37T11]|nr:hypothetical protein SAMN05216436_1142 [bacterium A37T11]
MNKLRKFLKAVVRGDREKTQWPSKIKDNYGISVSSMTFEELSLEKSLWKELLETYETHTLRS